MKQVLITIILLFSIQFSSLLAQNAVYLKSGKKIVCQNISIGRNNVTATVMSKGVERKKKYPNSSVKKALSDGIMKYSFRVDPESQKSMHIFASKIVAGKINVYTYEAASSHANGIDVIFCMYLEKGSDFKEIFNKYKKVEIKQKLKPFIGDDPEVLSLLNSEDFKVNSKNIKDAVEQYNFNAYQPLEANQSQPVGNVCFYRHSKNQLKEDAQIRIDNITCDLGKMQMKMVKLPADRPLKVCIENASGDNCQLITTPCDYIKYFEVSLNKKGEVELINRSQSHYDFFMKTYRQRR